MITLKDYYMGRDVTHKDELLPYIETNATDLLIRVNALLAELEIEKVIISSGWRPPSINSEVKGAAKNSSHVIGKAVDIATQEVANALLKQPHLLHKYSLWLESPKATPTWTHLDTALRPDRDLRVFKP